MIITLPQTTSAAIQRRLIDAREEGGAVALGRVLTFLIYTQEASVEEAIQAANEASSEHPMRIVVVAQPGTENDTPRLDAEIRVGGDAGASEVVVLRAQGAAGMNLPGLVNGLLLPDAPVVSWWADSCPSCMAETDLGQISQRRILDSLTLGNGLEGLHFVAQGYRPGDTDLAWGRITGWRTQLAATLDYVAVDSINSVHVAGLASNPSVALLAGWLGVSLGVPVNFDPSAPAGIGGVYSVRLGTPQGEISLTRRDDQTVSLSVPGKPEFPLLLPRRGLASLVAEELRRLGPDAMYGRVLTEGLGRIAFSTR